MIIQLILFLSLGLCLGTSNSPSQTLDQGVPMGTVTTAVPTFSFNTLGEQFDLPIFPHTTNDEIVYKVLEKCSKGLDKGLPYNIAYLQGTTQIEESELLKVIQLEMLKPEKERVTITCLKQVDYKRIAQKVTSKHIPYVSNEMVTGDKAYCDFVEKYGHLLDLISVDLDVVEKMRRIGGGMLFTLPDGLKWEDFTPEEQIILQLILDVDQGYSATRHLAGLEQYPYCFKLESVKERPRSDGKRFSIETGSTRYCAVEERLEIKRGLGKRVDFHWLYYTQSGQDLFNPKVYAYLTIMHFLKTESQCLVLDNPGCWPEFCNIKKGSEVEFTRKIPNKDDAGPEIQLTFRGLLDFDVYQSQAYDYLRQYNEEVTADTRVRVSPSDQIIFYVGNTQVRPTNVGLMPTAAFNAQNLTYAIRNK